MNINIHTSNFDKIPENTRFGLYCIHSKKDGAFYRLGCSGTSGRNKGLAGLKRRLKQHAGKCNNPINLAQSLASWEPLWACELLWPNLPLSTMVRLTKFAELAMFGHFVGVYTFDFREKDESIFCGDTGPERVRNHASMFEERLRSLLRLQGYPPLS